MRTSDATVHAVQRSMLVFSIERCEMGHQPDLAHRNSGHTKAVPNPGSGLYKDGRAPSRKEHGNIVLEQVTHRPKNLVRIQSPATSALFRSEKSVLRYALRQNRNVATPPLVHYYGEWDHMVGLASARNSDVRTSRPKMGSSAIALSEPMYLQTER